MRNLLLLALLALTAAAASAAGTDGTYKAPRNEHGQPDLQGVWNYSSDVPLERPREFADKEYLTREEREKRDAARDGNLEALAKLAPVEVADKVWLDYATHVENLRTSLIVHPENGRMPALVEGAQRAGGVAAFLNDIPGSRPVRFLFGGIGKDGPEDRGLAERCLAPANLPFVPGFDNNYMQVLQTRDHVVILAEGVSDARIIPLDGRPYLGAKLRSWSGDSRGRWEGDTLVVETRNFNGRTQSFNGSGTSDDKLVTERFTRVAKDALRYQATILDPKTFQDKVVLSFPMAKVGSRIYESACHEGNYSMPNILSGARKEEQEANR